MKALKNLTPNEQQALDELVGRLRHQFKKQVAHVILFGSRARGDASWESDFDLLIVTKNGGTKLEKTLTEFPNPIGFEHNLVLTSHVIPQKEFAQKRKAEPFYRSIYSEGIDLIGKKPRRLARGKPLVHRPPRRGFKMDENAKIQIKIRLEQARKDLATAHRTIIEDKNFPRAVSTAYCMWRKRTRVRTCTAANC